MILLAMVVGDEFRDSPSVMAFAERNHAVQTFLLDRADEPFGITGGRIEGRPASRSDRLTCSGAFACSTTRAFRLLTDPIMRLREGAINNFLYTYLFVLRGVRPRK
jgi:hypothetical protein